MNTLGERLRAARIEKRRTLQEVGAAAGVSKQAIGKIEKGETKDPGAVPIVAAAHYLGVNARWITEGKMPKDSDAGTPRGATGKVESEIEQLTTVVRVLLDWIVLTRPVEVPSLRERLEAARMKFPSGEGSFVVDFLCEALDLPEQATGSRQPGHTRASSSAEPHTE